MAASTGGTILTAEEDESIAYNNDSDEEDRSRLSGKTWGEDEPKRRAVRPRYSRTPSERMLLYWVLRLIAFLAFTTVAMMFALMKVSRLPVLGSQERHLVDLYERLTGTADDTWDELNNALLQRITHEEIDGLVANFKNSENPVDVATTVHNYWKGLDMDVVKIREYQVLVSTPDLVKRNKVKLYRGEELVLEARDTDYPSNERNAKAAPSAYLAYSPAGDVKGCVVYVNHAEDADFEFPKANNVTLKGCIHLVRIGVISKNEQVRNAQAHGAVGVVFFLPEDDLRNFPFPEPVWIGDKVIQPGSLASTFGDPLTPGYQSDGMMDRITGMEAGLPFIPAQAINEDDAAVIFTEMTKVECPSDWTVHLKLVPKAVPCKIASNSRVTLHLTTHNNMSMARIRNVLGMWKGDTEPDRLVMLGSRMARVESSRNPTVQWRSLGQLLEQSVAFRKLIRQHGWRPRRSLAFAFWEADEHNAVGASEWVEQHAALLGNEAVLYVHNGHVDGTDFEPHASPLVSTSLKEVASMVNLEGTSTTLKSAWDKRNSTPKHHLRTWPLNVIGQSDDGPFAFTAAVPTVTVSFGEASRPYGEWPAHRPDPWHTERPNTDPIQTAAQVAALMARVWADSLVLPYDPVALSEWIMKALKTFEARHVFVLGRSTLSIDSASKAAEEFYHATVSFVEYVNKVPRENPLVTRMINDIMRSLEKVFTIPGGVPTRHVAHRSILYSPEGLPFPGLEDLVRGAPIRKDAFNKHLTLITEAIIQATELLIATPF